MTVDNDREYRDDSTDGEEFGDDWFFDLPQGAWERQEAKRRQLRERLLRQAGDIEPLPPRKNPFGGETGQQTPARQKKGPRWSLFRRHHEDVEVPSSPAFRAEDFVMGAAGENSGPREQPAAELHASERASSWEHEPEVAPGADDERASLWDAALQQTEDPLEAMRRWAQASSPERGEGTSPEGEEPPPAEPDVRGQPAGVTARWSPEAEQPGDDVSLVELDALAREEVAPQAEDEFEPWAKELLAADEEPPPHQPGKRGLLGRLFGRSDGGEPDIDAVIAHAEAEGSWAPAADEGEPAPPAEPPDPVHGEQPPRAAPPPGDGAADPWAEFLRAREREQDAADEETAEAELLPFAEGSSTAGPVDPAATARVEEPHAETNHQSGDTEGAPSAWDDWPEPEDEAQAIPAFGWNVAAPAQDMGSEEARAGAADQLPAAQRPDGMWEPDKSADAESRPATFEGTEPAQSESWPRTAGFDAAGDAAPETDERTASSGDDDAARDDVWEAIAADQSDEEVGVFLRAPGVLGGRRLQQSALDDEPDDGWPEEDDETASAGSDSDVETARTVREEQAWVLEDDEDIIVRAFEEHAASAVDDDEEFAAEEPDASLEELLGTGVAPDGSIDDDNWTPHRVVEADDELVANFTWERDEDDPEEWHEEGPPWNRDGKPEAGEPREPRSSRSKTLIRELIETGLLALLVFLAVRASFQNFRVEGESMFPTLENGQYVIVNKLVYSEVDMGRLSDFVPIIDAEQGEKRYVFHGAQRGDIVVFHSPRDPSEDLIKRVIGLPGETIEILDGKVYVNDRLLEEPYITTPWSGNHPKILIPEDQYFVMGDNRNNSQDSRSPQVGLVHKDMIVGKVTLSYWPTDRFGLGPGGGARLTDELRPASVTAASAGDQ